LSVRGIGEHAVARRTDPAGSDEEGCMETAGPPNIVDPASRVAVSSVDARPEEAAAVPT
jgi:hypothetical protein